MIRRLHSEPDRAAVTAFCATAADYWCLADGQLDAALKAAGFFTDAPPGCDPARSHRLGLLGADSLIGLAELAFGFPTPRDAYLSLMILAPRTRNLGYGRIFLAHIEDLARNAAAPNLYLAVLAKNVCGVAFWARMGFRPTGHSGTRHSTGQTSTLHRLVKALSA